MQGYLYDHYRDLASFLPTLSLKVLRASGNLIYLVIVPVLSFFILKDGTEPRDASKETSIEREQRRANAYIEHVRQQGRSDEAGWVRRQLDADIATLRLELGAIQREKLALQETIDREPRIETAKRQHFQIELVVMAVLLLVTLLLLGYVAFRYRGVRDRLHHLTMERVSELRIIGGHHEQSR